MSRGVTFDTIELKNLYGILKTIFENESEIWGGIMKLNSDNRLVFDFNDVLNVILELSHSQGFYGRLLNTIYELMEYDPERFDMFVEEIENADFRSSLDVVMYFEG